MERNVTKAGEAIKAVLDLEQDNNLLADLNDQLEFENDQIRRNNALLASALKEHIGKLKKDIKEMEWMEQDFNWLLCVALAVVIVFYWSVLHG